MIDAVRTSPASYKFNPFARGYCAITKVFCNQLILRGLRVLRGKSLLKYRHFIGTLKIATFHDVE